MNSKPPRMSAITPTRQLQFTCRVCAESALGDVFAAREMMFGSRASFDYLRCGDCGCLQILEVPNDLHRFYPSNYYSQQSRVEPTPMRGIKGWLARRFCKSLSLKPDALSTAVLRAMLPTPGDFAEYGEYLQTARLVSSDDRILDVGCGASPHRLAAMRRCGFTQVEGIDPFINTDSVYHGVPVHKCTIAEVTGIYGLVMFHHSLEHVPDPLTDLRNAARLLRPGGICLVRVPVMGTYFWRHFGTDWVELDAPRHLYLLSLEAVGRLASRAGFRVRRTVFDSEPWELAGSLRYQCDLSISDVDPNVLSEAGAAQQRIEHTRIVEQLNRLGDAGRACFYLERLAVSPPLDQTLNTDLSRDPH